MTLALSPGGFIVSDHGRTSTPGLGPLVAHLEQVQGDSFGRSGFYFHGPSMDPAHMGQESKGCIVVQHASREKVKQAAPDGSYVQVFA